MAWDTILIDGTDVETATRFAVDHDGFHGTPPMRGELPTFPGVDGETNVDQPFGPTVFPLQLMLLGEDVTTANDEMRTLRRLCKPGGTVTLTKQMAFTSGDESHIATGKLRNILVSQPSPESFLAVVEFSILEGVWYGTSTSTTSLSSGLNTPNIGGDVRTKNMTITLTGGTTPQLVNNTTGFALSFNGAMGSPVVIDVLNATATQGATDVSDLLTHTQGLPFALAPGTNQIALFGFGSGSITYTRAY